MDEIKGVMKGTSPHHRDIEKDNSLIKNSSQYKCEICKDTKMMQVKSGGWARCKCDLLSRAKKIIESSGINPGDNVKTFSSFNSRGIENIDKAKENAIFYYKMYDSIEKSRHNSIVFCGLMNEGSKVGVGVGKTHLGIALTNNFLEKGIEVVYMSYREEITRIKQLITDESSYQKAIGRYKNARILFIDDLFKGKTTEADINAMYEIINHRYLSYKPMIVTSEYDMNKMDDIDQAIASRVFEMSRGFYNVMGGQGANFRYQ